MSDFIPLPPPWRQVDSVDGSSNTFYVNELTGEISDIHPIEKIIKSRKSVNNSERSLQTLREDTSGDQVAHLSENDEFPEGIDENDQQNRAPSNSNYVEFRCEWTETSPIGKFLPYCVLVRFFDDDHHVEIKFDGIDGEWAFSFLNGPYGPVERCDLFIGAQLTLFGRRLSISSANASVCLAIDQEAKKLKFRRAWLQQKIECIGAIPVVRRDPPTVTRHILRESKGAGRANLRQLLVEITKLEEQLAELGLTHFLTMPIKTENASNSIFSATKILQPAVTR